LICSDFWRSAWMLRVFCPDHSGRRIVNAALPWWVPALSHPRTRLAPHERLSRPSAPKLVCLLVGGGLEVEFQVLEPHWLARHILQLGADAEVVEPPAIRALMRRVLAAGR